MRGFASRARTIVVAFSLMVVSTTAAAEEARLRVATLLPLAEDALAHAENVRVVATIRRDLHRPVAEGLEDLGSPHSPNLEALARSRAQLVIGDPHIHAVFARKIEALGAEMFLLDSSGVEATLRSLLELAEHVDASQAIAARIEEVRSTIDALKLEAPVKVLLLFGRPGAFYVVSNRAWLGDLASQLGFVNLAPETGSERISGYIAVNDEALMMLEPDLVALVAHGDPRKIEAELRDKTRADGPWASLGRARLGIHALSPALFSVNPGLGLDSSAAALISLVKPDATPQVSAGPAPRGGHAGAGE